MAKNIVLIHGAFCGGWCFADIMPVFAARGWTLPGAGPAVPRAGSDAHARPAARKAEHRRLHARHGGVRRPPSRAAGHRRPFHGRAHRASSSRPRGSPALSCCSLPVSPWGVLPSTASRDDAGQGADDGVAVLGQGAQSVVRGGEGGLACEPRSGRRSSASSTMFSAESGLALFELFFWMFDKQRTTAVETGKVTCPGAGRVRIGRQGDLAGHRPQGRRALRQRHVRGGVRPRPLPDHGGGGSQLAGRCADWLAKVTK